MFQTKLKGATKLIWKVINFAEHVEEVQLFETVEIIEVHNKIIPFTASLGKTCYRGFQLIKKHDLLWVMLFVSRDVAVKLLAECKGVEANVWIEANTKLQNNSHNPAARHIPDPIARLARYGSSGITSNQHIAIKT